MSPRLYSALLHLLPRDRRDRYGAEMSATFADLITGTRRDRGILATGWLWMKEAAGLARFGWRERAARLAARTPVLRGLAGGPIGPILRDAWRGVRGRRGRAIATVTLLALVFAINALAFAVADALIFTPVGYPNAERLIEIHEVHKNSESNFMSPRLLDAWQAQTDLFAGVQGYLIKSGVFLIDASGVTEKVTTADVTPGTLALLGTPPRWGRAMAPDDAAPAGMVPTILSYDLAVRRFGAPERAIGQRLGTNTDPLIVIGVMPPEFRFPSGTVALWRAMDPRGPLTANFDSVSSIARLAPAVTRDAANGAIAQRAAAIGRSVGLPTPYDAKGALFIGARQTPKAQVFLLLLGSAACLLLTACASVSSMELAGAVSRARTYAVQRALGASRSRLALTAGAEGAIIIGSATLAGGLLAWWATGAITAMVPMRLASTANRAIVLDGRVLVFVVAVAALAWAATSVPLLLSSWRPTLLSLLKTEDRASAASRVGARARRLLTGLEIGLASMLLIAGLCCAKSYAAFLAIDKGFDSRNLAEISFDIPENFYQSADARHALDRQVIDALLRVRGVVAVAPGTAPPGGNSPSQAFLQVDSRPRSEQRDRVSGNAVDPSYLALLHEPLIRGRLFQPSEPPTSAIVSVAFAEHLVGSIDAVGHAFSTSVQGPTYEVVGVVPTIQKSLNLPADGAEEYRFFTATQPPRPSPAPPPTFIANGGMFRFAPYTIRLESHAAARDALAAARAIDPRLGADITFVDDAYADTVGDVELATRVISALGLAAFVIAIAGVYGVMAFLAAARTREIGVRMALGADRRDIVRLILGSSTSLIAGGLVAGVLGAVALSRVMVTLLTGVALVNASTYALVTALVACAAVVATWQPARRAARTNPAITLRQE